MQHIYEMGGYIVCESVKCMELCPIFHSRGGIPLQACLKLSHNDVLCGIDMFTQ